MHVDAVRCWYLDYAPRFLVLYVCCPSSSGVSVEVLAAQVLSWQAVNLHLVAAVVKLVAAPGHIA